MQIQGTFITMFTIVMSFSCVSCEPDSSSSISSNYTSSIGSKLPENPKKIIFRWFDDGGMLDMSKKIFISKDSCFKFINRYGHHQKIYFTVTDKEIKELYSVFINQRYDEIEENKDLEVYDRGGVSLFVKADGEYFNKSNAGRSFIRGKSLINYTACEKAIHNLVDKKIASQKLTVLLVLSEPLMKADKNILLHVNNRVVFDSKKEELKEIIRVDVYPGESMISLRTTEKEEQDRYGVDKLYSYLDCFVDIQNSEQKILIELINKEIVIKDGVPY